MCQIIQKERRNDLGMNWKTYIPELRKRGINNAAQAAAALAAIKSVPGANASDTCPYQGSNILISEWNWYYLLAFAILPIIIMAIGFLLGWKCRGVYLLTPPHPIIETNEEPDPQPDPDDEETITIDRFGTATAGQLKPLPGSAPRARIA